ncbi:hypothetical protein Hokovirus_2_146 [Hokovirus HKV1]|uniref:Uncharacterized protein n=1 Tax=Hokovirus HKV1 TaxID=1977638 RepID=A0A1V0SFW8_9VIRU|nr:hypothetical protein Hokovirus_2_146 [Hokovirus HKV1]
MAEFNLLNIKYKIFIHPKQATIGSIAFVARNAIDKYKKFHKINDDMMFNECYQLLDDINTLYQETLKISFSMDYVNFIRKIFENDYALGFKVDKDIYNEYFPYKNDKVQLVQLNVVKLFEILFLKLRFWGYVLSELGINGYFSDEQAQLRDLFNTFLSKYTRNETIVAKKNYRKNKQTEEMEEYYIEYTLYSEKWIEDFNLKIRSFEQNKK